MFIYLCENCDCAGFWEINLRKAAFDTGILETDIDKCLDSLGDRIIRNCKFLWLRKFLLHQRNIPLNPGNNAHKAIFKRLSEFVGMSIEIKELVDSYLAPDQGLARSPGKGKGSSKNSSISVVVREEFEKWWSGEDGEAPYPRKIAKGVALASYAKARLGASQEEISIGKRNYVATCIMEGTEQQYMPYPSTWLNQERWKDYQDAPTKSSTKHLSNKQTGRQGSEYAHVLEGAE